MENQSKPCLKIARLIAIWLAFASWNIPLTAQDAASLANRFQNELAKIQSNEQGINFFLTNIKGEYGLTANMVSFINELAGGKYVKQIDYIMSVPEQRWNMAGWGYYERVNVVRIVNKNVVQSSALNRVNTGMSNISKALSYYSLATNIFNAIKGDNQAKLNSIKGTYDLVSGYLTSDFPGLGVAMIGVGVINYALTKFINTAIGTYEDYWWIAYSNYLGAKYPSFVNDWAPLIEQGGFQAIESRLDEFWADAELNAIDYHGQASWQTPPEYAKNNFKAKFAALYYRDRLHNSVKTWYMRKATQQQGEARNKFNANSNEIKNLVTDLKTLMKLIELANKKMKEDAETVASVSVSPASVELETGDVRSFKATAAKLDGSTEDVTEIAAWSGGSANTFTAREAGTFTISATYREKSGTASITVMSREEECGENAHWDPASGSCVCDDGYDWSEELGKCISIDDALTEGGGDDWCDENALNDQWGQIRDLVANAETVGRNFQSRYAKFLKEINDQNADPCKNGIVALAYAGAKNDLAKYELLKENVASLSEDLIVRAGICPDLSLQFDSQSIVSVLRRLGSQGGQIKRGIADMGSQLSSFSCDPQEVEENGNQIAESGADPEVVEQGGSGTVDICDGEDNDGDGLFDEDCIVQGNFNVLIIVFDSGNLKDDVFSLSVTGQGNLGNTPEGGARSYQLNLAPGNYVATVTVVAAPDNVGTFTITVNELGRVIASQSGQPGHGARVDISFTVGQMAGGSGAPLMPGRPSNIVAPPSPDETIFFDEKAPGEKQR